MVDSQNLHSLNFQRVNQPESFQSERNDVGFCGTYHRCKLDRFNLLSPVSSIFAGVQYVTIHSICRLGIRSCMPKWQAKRALH